MALADFTAEEVANITASLLDYNMKGRAKVQNDQARPLYAAMRAAQKTFPGGKELITGPVVVDTDEGFRGYSGDDEVDYDNPTGTRRWTYPWYELHDGISVTHTELKHAGITVSESSASQSTSVKDGAKMFQLTNMLDEKIQRFIARQERSYNLMLLRDGTADPKAFPGLKALVRDNPTVGIVGGIDSATNTWWRNRARTTASGGTITASTDETANAIRTLQIEMRQLRRYGGRPNKVLAGSAAIERIEREIHRKGDFTLSGFNSDFDISMGDIMIRGVGKMEYDPTLDDEGNSGRVYILDTRHICPYVMAGEDMKQHSPARPENKYVMYKAVTWTGGFVADQLNCHGVYDIV
jgi:hypothetical protein